MGNFLMLIIFQGLMLITFQGSWNERDSNLMNYDIKQFFKVILYKLWAIFLFNEALNIVKGTLSFC